MGYSPPFSVRFNNGIYNIIFLRIILKITLVLLFPVRNEGKFLAMVDEEGWIDIVNTKLDSSDPCNMGRLSF